jgi:cholesterol oxidase
MTAEGMVTAPALSPDPLIVEAGTFQLSVPVAGVPRSFHMVYRLPLVASDGSRFELDGFKVIEPGALDDLWPETTTLYVTLRRDGNVIGLGIMRLSVQHLVALLRTMTVSGSVGHVERLELLATFGARFAGELARDYGHVVHPSTPMVPNARPRVRRPLDVPRAEVHRLVTEDGVPLRLTRYNGGETRRGGAKATVVLSHGMGANPLTFSTDLVRPNLLEFLVGHGYDVWLQEWRGSTLLERSRTTSFNGDQVARLDHPATQRTIEQATGAGSVHWVTHCVGTMTVLMSTMAGDLQPASLVCSSAGAHPVASRLIRFKTGLHVAELLRRLGVKRLTTDSSSSESVWERVFDKLVRLNWVPSDERCDEAVCHRLEFIYGVATHHAAIDELSHAALHELFGITNLEMLAHLSECARRQSLVDASGRDAYVPHLDRLDLPITFLHGDRNLVWLPQSSADTFDLLSQMFGPHQYARHTFAEHGHQDLIMGSSAPRDVFPRILEHLEHWA